MALPGLSQLLKLLGTLGDESRYYETEPIYRPGRQNVRLNIPDISPDEYNPEEWEGSLPVERPEVVGQRRTGKLTGLGRVMKEVLPQALRGAVVAAGSPTPGQVGTAGDIFGGLRAAGEDRDRRDMLAYQMKRQAEQDALQEELRRSQVEENRAQAERAASMGRRQAANPEEMIAQAETAIGRKLSQQEKLTLLRIYNPQNLPRVSISDNESLLAAEFERLTRNPSEDPDGSLRKEIRTKLDQIEAGKVKKPTGPPWMRPIVGKEGITVARPKLGPGGELAGVESAYTKIGDMPPQKTARPAQPRQATPMQARSIQLDRLKSRVLAEANGDPAAALANLKAGKYAQDKEVKEFYAALVEKFGGLKAPGKKSAREQVREGLGFGAPGGQAPTPPPPEVLATFKENDVFEGPDGRRWKKVNGKAVLQ